MSSMSSKSMWWTESWIPTRSPWSVCLLLAGLRLLLEPMFSSLETETCVAFSYDAGLVTRCAGNRFICHGQHFGRTVWAMCNIQGIYKQHTACVWGWRGCWRAAYSWVSPSHSAQPVANVPFCNAGPRKSIVLHQPLSIVPHLIEHRGSLWWRVYGDGWLSKSIHLASYKSHLIEPCSVW